MALAIASSTQEFRHSNSFNAAYLAPFLRLPFSAISAQSFKSVSWRGRIGSGRVTKLRQIAPNQTASRLQTRQSEDFTFLEQNHMFTFAHRNGNRNGNGRKKGETLQTRLRASLRNRVTIAMIPLRTSSTLSHVVIFSGHLLRTGGYSDSKLETVPLSAQLCDSAGVVSSVCRPEFPSQL